MDGNRLLTVIEYAEREKVSRQAIYRRLKNDKWKEQHSKIVDGKVYIDVDTFQQEQMGNDTLEGGAEIQELVNEIDRLQQEIAELRERLQKSEQHIDELTAGWRESQRNVSVLTHQLLLLESADTVSEPEKETTDIRTEEPEQAQIGKKVGILSRLFSRNVHK